MKGYKVADKNVKFKIGETYCNENGFSFYKNPIDCFNCFKFNPRSSVFEIKITDEIKEDQGKFFTSKFKIIRELSWHEILDLATEGYYINYNGYKYDSNIGKYNLGSYNIGNINVGDFNIGSINSGNYNSGNANVGDYNLGHYNSGNNNIGHENLGNFNVGCDNIGNYNTGIGNLTHYNTGDFNTGNFNTGVFNTTSECIRMFNKDTNLTYDEWLSSDVRKILINNFNLTEWVKAEDMTDIEKTKHIEHVLLRGYLKVYTYKQAWKNLWDKITQEEKEKIMSLPNFDKDIFQEITGIDVSIMHDNEKNIKKTSNINAIPYEKGLEDGFKCMKENIPCDSKDSSICNDCYLYKPYIKTLEGDICISNEYMIIINENGQKIPCKKHIFDMIYGITK